MLRETVVLLFVMSFGGAVMPNLVCAGESADTVVVTGPKVYIDCDGCDHDYFRTEITFVNFVRDRKQADIHILVSTQPTGAGGEEYSIEFIGREELEGMRDTLQYVALESDSEDDTRAGLAKTIKLGLVRYVVRSPVADDLAISYTQPAEETEVADPWNNWVISLSGDSWINGEQSYHSLSMWGNISARRVTEAVKMEFEVYGNYSESKFDYEDYSTLSISRSKGADAEAYFSLDDHWSAGGYVDVYSSTYSNKDWALGASPAIEYNIYPYRESTRRQLRLSYYAGMSYHDYEEETIFNETTELLFRHTLRATLDVIQPWGSVYASLSGSHYLHDAKKNRLTLYTRLSLKVVQGLSFNINGNVSRIRDQISLRRGDATEEEVLLRRRELETDYNYWGSIGFSYSFGSIYNNIVNPRFGN